ncbi:MAG: O-antigen ligase family protein [Acutalibacteraceae bacterium]|nr:O-antigen ligase family protein [Acutalibacteraceae bacterium]
MKIKKSVLYSIMSSCAVFLLIYYCYMNSLRRYFIPASAITVPLILAFVAVTTLITNSGKIKLYGTLDKVLCGSWFFIAVLILIDNHSLSTSFVSGGMIQLYVMICFLLFMNNDDKWIEQWLSLTIFFVGINALATIIFYFNSSLYKQFINIFFSGETITSLLNYYSKGYMCGLCTHFSSNGMILGIGTIVVFQKLKGFFIKKDKNKKNTKTKVLYTIVLLLVIYGLFLSSKRSPLIAAIIAIVITLLIASGKNILKKLMILIGSFGGLAILYFVAVEYIPGFDTIANKFTSLESSDAGVLNGRNYLWELAIDLFKESPLIGNGYGSYAAYAESVDAFTTSAHNYYLQILAELGIIGLILYLIAFISSVIFTAKLIVKASKINVTEEDIAALSISLGIQMFVLIYNFTATSLMYYSILIPYILSCTVPRIINKKYFYGGLRKT